MLPFLLLTFQHVEQGKQQSIFCEGQVFAWHNEISVFLKGLYFFIFPNFPSKDKGKGGFFLCRWTMFFHFQNTWKQTLVHSRTAFRSQSRTDYRQTAHGLARKLLFAKCTGSVQTVEAKRRLDRAVCSLRVDVVVSRGLLTRNSSLYQTQTAIFTVFTQQYQMLSSQ